MVDLLELRLDLLTSGVRVSQELKNSFDGYKYKRASLSEGECFNIAETSILNIPIHEKFVERSPYYYSYDDKIILKDGIPIVKAELIERPIWYSFRFHDDTPYNSIIQIHSKDILATSLTNYCEFKLKGIGCKFCALSPNGSKLIKNPYRISYIVEDIEKKGFRYRELNINGGTIDGDDFLIKLYTDVIKAVRKISSIAISAQIYPPKDLKMIDFLKDSGLNTISFNLEIYDEDIRKIICPGKSSLSREYYINALKYAVKIFGKNQVSSWLIAGLEPPESTIKGARILANIGVIPFITIFRPLIGTEMEELSPPILSDLVKVFNEVGKIIKDSNLNIYESECGCINCDCCSALKEVVSIG